MKELGGYFELELNDSGHYHCEAIGLNSGRNCLKYILRTQKPDHIFLPAYCCDSLIEPLISESVAYNFFHLDEQFEITELPELKNNQKILYINYFGMKSDYIQTLYARYGQQLIVDNTQAFFEMPIKNIDTFYSPRKFFGIPDGGYLYTDGTLKEELETDVSYHKMQHLLGRIDKDAATFYEGFQQNEKALTNEPIKRMSQITDSILRSVNYQDIAKKRRKNFGELGNLLKDSENLKLLDDKNFVPMIYPFRSDRPDLRARLIDEKIYVPLYWTEAQDRLNSNELNMMNGFVFLPIDQRLSSDDVQRIYNVMAEI